MEHELGAVLELGVVVGARELWLEPEGTQVSLLLFLQQKKQKEGNDNNVAVAFFLFAAAAAE